MNTEIRLNTEKVIGPVKPMHGVGQPPLLGTNTDYFHYLSDANIPYSRLHDVAGWFGGNMYVDIPNIFRDFDADVDDPASYDFVFTDLLLKALHEHHCEPVYRLGITIENFHDIKPYRCFPPKDFMKWARICEHIIRHYNEGWADGFHFNIQYWEIWNEPDGHYLIEENAMWKGTPEQYYDLYRITSKHLRECFGHSIKIGGYASCGFYQVLDEQLISGEAFGSSKPLNGWQKRIMGFIDFFDGFIKMVAEEKLPFDFFSHHSYGSVKDTLKMQEYCEKRLEEAGLGDVEIQLNEWNPNPRMAERGTALACANATAMMCAMQNRKMDVMCYYDGRIGTSVYGGLFHPMTYQPLCAYYGFKAYGKLYALGTQIESVCDNENVYAVAAKGDAGKGIVIANIGEDTDVSVNLGKTGKLFVIDDDNFFTEKGETDGCFSMKKNQVVYIEF